MRGISGPEVVGWGEVRTVEQRRPFGDAGDMREVPQVFDIGT